MSDEDNEFACNSCHGVFIGERAIPVGMNGDTGDIIYLCVGCALEAASERGG